jgi:flagellar hook assembly protein FlgD
MTRLDVFNLLGQRVITLVDRYLPAGDHTALWNGFDAAGRAVPSGVYLYRLESGTHVAQLKMTLTK